MATVESLLVEVRADISGMQKELRRATKSTNKLAKETKKTGKQFQQHFANAARSVAILEGPLGGVAGRLGAVGSALGAVNPMVVAFGVAAAAATATLVGSVKAAEKSERQMFKLEALLKSTGNASGFTAEQIDKMARAIALNTLASKRGIRDAAGILLTFKAVSGDVFERTLQLSQDMAAVMGTDAKNAALQLAKALEDPATGLTALRRSGVSFTQTEKDMITQMFQAGKTAEAQGLILDKLAGQIGGAGAGEAKGMSGAVDTLGQRWDDLMESIGKSGPLAVTTEMVKDLAGAIETLNNWAFPQEQQRFNELLAKRLRIMHDIRKAREQGMSSGVMKVLLKREYEVNAELVKINKDRLTRAEKQAKAETAAKKSQQELAAQQAADVAAQAAEQAGKDFDAMVQASEDAVKKENVAYQAWLTTQENAAQKLRETLNPMEELESSLARLDVLYNAGLISIDAYASATFNALDEMESKVTTVTAAEQSRLDQITDLTKQMEEQLNTQGMNNRELLQYRLELLEVAPAQQQYILGLHDQTEAAKEHAEQVAEMEQMTKEWGDRLLDTLLDGKMGFKDFIRSVLADIARLQAKKALEPLIGGMQTALTGGFFGGPGGGSQGGGGGFLGSIMSGIGSLLSFSGGGDTGNAPRSGGMDGQGGFLAMLHPQEDVYDRARGGGGGGVTIHQSVSVDARGATDPQAVEVAVMRAVPGIVAQSVEAMRSAKTRGQLPEFA